MTESLQSLHAKCRFKHCSAPVYTQIKDGHVHFFAIFSSCASSRRVSATTPTNIDLLTVSKPYRSPVLNTDPQYILQFSHKLLSRMLHCPAHNCFIMHLLFFQNLMHQRPQGETIESDDVVEAFC